MKLRIARKVTNPAKSHDRYRSSTLERALRRMAVTATDKRTNRYWTTLMDFLGPEGRRDLVSRIKLRMAKQL